MTRYVLNPFTNKLDANDGAGGGGSGNVSSTGTITDNSIVRGDGGGRNIQDSGVLIDDSDNITAAESLTFNLGTDVNEFSTDGTLAGDSDSAAPTEKAVKTYADAISTVADTLASLGAATYNTIQDGHNITGGTGIITGGTITDSGSGQIDVSAITGMIRATDDTTDDLEFFDLGAQTNVALTDDDLNYIYVEYNGGTPQLSVVLTPETDLNTNIQVGLVFREATTLHINDLNKQISSNHPKRVFEKDTSLFGIQRESGGIFSETGTRNVAVTAATLWCSVSATTTTPLDTSVTGDFHLYYRDGGGGWTESETDVLGNTQYDDGDGTLGTLGNQKWGVYWGYIGVDSTISILYGQAEYANQGAAEAASAPSSVPESVSGTSILGALFVFKKSDTNFTEVLSAFETTFNSTPVTDHGDLSGLTDDDHTQYLLANGTRALAGAWDMDSQATTNVNIDSGTITGITDLLVADGGTGRSTSTTAYGVLCAGTTATGAHQTVDDVGAAGTVLTSNGAGVLPSMQAAGGGSMPPREFFFDAADLQALETNFAPLEKLAGTNIKTFVRAFDDTTEEFANCKIQVPGDLDGGGTVTFRWYAMAKTAAADKHVKLTVGHLAVNDSEDFDQAYTDKSWDDEDIDGTQDDVTEFALTETVGNLGWAANDLVFLRFSREVASNDNLADDMYLFSICIELPRS